MSSVGTSATANFSSSPVGNAAANPFEHGDLQLQILIAFALLSILVFTSYSNSRSDKLLAHIPPVGCTGPATFYLGALNFFVRAPTVLANGYRSHKAKLYRVVFNLQWQVAVSGTSYLKDLSEAPESVLSVDAANDERFQVPYTIGSQLWSHGQTIRGLIKQLTRDVDLFMAPLMDELTFVIDQLLVRDRQTSDWVSIGCLDFSMKVIRQVNTRVFVGAEKARDTKYMEAVMGFPQKIVIVATVLQWLPRSLKPFFARLLKVSSEYDYAARRLIPLVEARKGDDIDFTSRTYDALSRVIDHGQHHGTDSDAMVFHTMMINFAAMHSSTYTLGHALLRLAIMSEFSKTLRKEVRQVVQERGWTKAGLGEMKKLDSFLRESQRVDSIAAVGSTLKVMEPFTFSDGVTLPSGTTVFVPMKDIHMDENYFSNAETFDPLRFYSPETRGSVSYTSATGVYVGWGFGKHTCPGRFYASALLKSILAHLLINFEIRLLGGATEKPADFWFESNRLPNLFAKLQIRRIVDDLGS